MADQPELTPIDDEEPEETPGYRAPAEKSLDELKGLDADDDESLVRYKQELLAGVDPAAAPADDPRRVIVEQMAFVVRGKEDVTFDLTHPNTMKLTMKEGTEYQIRIGFKVQHEIVENLQYHHVLQRNGITVAEESYMVGSPGPKVQTQSWLSSNEFAPKGAISHGTYKVRSKLTDGDRNVHREWECEMNIE